MTVAYYTITGSTNLSTTITGESPGTTYYYTITAYNNTTPGPTSSVQSSTTQTGSNNQLLMINGKAYLTGGKGVTSGVQSTGATNYILNSTNGQILINGQVLNHS